MVIVSFKSRDASRGRTHQHLSDENPSAKFTRDCHLLQPTDKGCNISNEPHTEGKTLCRPIPPVQNGMKNINCAPMRSQIDQSYNDGDEAGDVEEEDEAFNHGQKATDHRIDEDCDSYHSPTEEGALVLLGVVVGVIKNYDALDHCPNESAPCS
ncbi:MAG: hypothetical protein LQ349_006695 [Xanthoria aureola]|nr:MAG: hypothetical protein LQ349_006695 [Xanthoria aureola]